MGRAWEQSPRTGPAEKQGLKCQGALGAACSEPPRLERPGGPKSNHVRCQGQSELGPGPADTVLFSPKLQRPSG